MGQHQGLCLARSARLRQCCDSGAGARGTAAPPLWVGAGAGAAQIFWTGVVTEALSALASGVGPGPYLSSVSTASHFLAGCAQERSWEMQRSRMAV